jgi:hypothetical protein
MREYEANKLAVRTNTARLRALRLAKEAENRQYTNTKKAVKEDRNLFKAWRNKRSSAT